MANDAQLLRSYLEEHSQAAFNELVKRHLNLVYFTALRQNGGDLHGSNDITQKVFLRLIAKARSLTDRASLAGWLFKTVRYEVSHAARTERRRAAREKASQAMNELLGGSELPPDWQQLKPVIDDVLHQLSDKDREVVLLRFFQASAFGSIGERLGLSEDAARLRLQRALKKMRSLLAQRGVDSTTAALTLALTSQADAAAPAELLAGVIKASIAPGAASLSPAIKLLQIMTTTKAFLGISAAISLLLIALAVRDHVIAIETGYKVSAEKRGYESDLARMASLARRARDERTDVESFKLAVERSERHLHRPRVGGGASLPAASGMPLPVAKRTSPAINRELSRNPAVRKALTGWIKANLNVYDAPLFKALNLSREQIDAFGDLILQQNLPMGDTVLTLRPDDVTQNQVEQQIYQLLGDDGYQQYVQANRIQYVRSVANGLAGNLYYTEAPLTSQQADQLTQALSTTVPPTVMAFPGMVNWPQALTLAEGILSPPQLAAFQKEVSILAGQPGVWSGINAMGTLSPGAYASGQAPPPTALTIRDQGQ